MDGVRGWLRGIADVLLVPVGAAAGIVLVVALAIYFYVSSIVEGLLALCKWVFQRSSTPRKTAPAPHFFAKAKAPGQRGV